MLEMGKFKWLVMLVVVLGIGALSIRCLLALRHNRSIDEI
jgi:hypothetical protein